MPFISLPPLAGPNNKEEGEADKILFSIYNQLLSGKNDIIVAIYDTNIETDIAIDVIIIIMRRIVGCILSLIHPVIQTLLFNLNHYY
jgi:hypothetical protein